MKTMLRIYAIFALIFFVGFSPQAKSKDYCVPSFNSPGVYMGARGFYLEDIKRLDATWSSTGYTYDKINTTTLNPGETYEWEAVLCIEGNYCYQQILTIWIDLNQDGEFTTDELIYSTRNQMIYEDYQSELTIPDDVTTGTTRLRFMSEYFYMQSGYINPCNQIYYGSVYDFDIEIAPKGPDASVEAIVMSEPPLQIGEQTIAATIKSNNDFEMNSVNIHWSVNGIEQETFKWTGRLGENEQTTVDIGSYNFEYPINGPYKAFQVRVWTSEPNGGKDSDISNDSKQIDVSFVLDDAGIAEFVTPVDNYAPGQQPINIRLKNYGPKPLVSAQIHWSANGVKQKIYQWEGELFYNETVDIYLGDFDIQYSIPMSPYEFKAWTERPNNTMDQLTHNDMSTHYTGPSLTPGTFSIGGTNSHFKDPVAFSNYLNASGFIGKGHVDAVIRPGQYVGQLYFANLESDENSLTFKSSTGKANDVTLSYAPNSSGSPDDNYVLRFSNYKNVTIRDITIKNTSPKTNNAGRALFIENSDNIQILNCAFSSLSNSPKNTPSFNTYAVIDIKNSTNVGIKNNNINDGAIGLNNDNNMKDNSLVIQNNTFNNQSWISLRNITHTASGNNSAIIKNNKIQNYSSFPQFGILSSGNSHIEYNTIGGIRGSNDLPYESAIRAYSDPDVTGRTAEVIVKNNTMSNLTDVNGIYLEKVKATVIANRVNINCEYNDNTPFTIDDIKGRACIILDESYGDAGNNMLIGNNVAGARFISSPQANFFYNSVKISSDRYPVIWVNNNAGKIYRNVFNNAGKSYVLNGLGEIESGDNIYYTRGSEFAEWDGGISNSLEDWIINTTFDSKSAFEEVQFRADNDLRLDRYFTKIAFNEPLSFIPDDIQEKDLSGTIREMYFAGIDELPFNINVTRISDDVLDCNNAERIRLSINAGNSFNVKTFYQWQKDGVDIPDENGSVLQFDTATYHNSGVYTCKISVEGINKSHISDPIVVYILTAPAITKQHYINKTQGTFDRFALTGDIVNLSIETHMRGITPPFYKDKFEWYRFNGMTGTAQLLDESNPKYGGVHSSELSINGITIEDLDENSYYYAVVEGLCGTVTSEPFRISAAPDFSIEFTKHPETIVVCTDEEAFFEVEAEGSIDVEQIIYQWYKDGIKINDNDKYSGAKTEILSIQNVEEADIGEYYVVATTIPGNNQFTTMKAMLDILPLPVLTKDDGAVFYITAVDENTNSRTFEIEAENAESYQWYHNDEIIEDMTTNQIIVEYNKDNVYEIEGVYYCVVSNVCGNVQSKEHQIILAIGGGSSVSEAKANGYILYNTEPNPVSNTAMIKFDTPSSLNAEVFITDIYGNKVATVFSGISTAGTNTLTINAQELNLSSGVYYYTLVTQQYRLTNKFVIIR